MAERRHSQSILTYTPQKGVRVSSNPAHEPKAAANSSRHVPQPNAVAGPSRHKNQRRSPSPPHERPHRGGTSKRQSSGDKDHRRSPPPHMNAHIEVEHQSVNQVET